MIIELFPEKSSAMNRRDCASIISPENSVKVSLARIQKTRIARTIFMSWPNLEAACVKLARIITHTFPDIDDENQFLLDRAILESIEAYEEKSLTATREEEMSLEFLRTLIATGAKIIMFDVHVQNTDETTYWAHYTVPLTDWVKKNHGVNLIYTKREDVSNHEQQVSRTLMASHLCSVAVLTKMQSDGGIRVVA